MEKGSTLWTDGTFYPNIDLQPAYVEPGAVVVMMRTGTIKGHNEVDKTMKQQHLKVVSKLIGI